MAPQQPVRCAGRSARARARARALAVASGVLVTAFALSGCGTAAADDDEPEHRAFPYSGKTLRIDADNTSLDLVPADVDEIEVTRWFDGWTAIGGDVKKVWEVEGDTLRLGIDCQGLIDNCDSRHRVKVPRDLALTVDNDNGAVVANGFTADLDITSGNGSVRVGDPTGRLDLKSDNGRVEATGVASRDVAASSDNGRVELAFAEVPDRVDAKSDNGRVGIRLPDGAYRVEAEADNGDVDITVPRDDRSEHHVTARSDNGGISVRTAN
ncbi:MULTISPECIES: DUF4097 family beta strand repeat-containing protein [Streptomyces]|uniref:DUF4097 family beta strand repeat-containing protein n=1 Tax=Streptomyces TaxID=1883 RepID=UPI001F3409AB|nr:MULTISPECIES: DUF4097 family beta strand repeat-containing protein [Streptomyces]